MAKFPKRRRLSTLPATVLIASLVIYPLALTGCDSIRALFADQGVTKPKNNFLKKLKEKDVPGEEIKDLPRYTGSIRVSYTIVTGENKKNSGVIVYQSADARDKVIDFYLKAAPANGWTTGDIVDTSDGKIVQLSKDNRRLSLSIVRRAKSKYTEITYVYREY